MDCDNMTKDELVELAASDWGFTEEDAVRFKLEILRSACKSFQGAQNYLLVCSELVKDGFMSEDVIFD